MDHPLPSDALDIAFHPSRSHSLLAVGLIDGKVTLVDHSKAFDEATDDNGDDEGAAKVIRGVAKDVTEEGDDDDDMPSTSQRRTKTTALWTRRISHKSVRGVCFPGGSSSLDYVDGEESSGVASSAELWSITKDGTLHLLDVERGGEVVKGWYKGCKSPPSILRYVEPNVLMTGDDEGVVSLWDTRMAASLPPLGASGKPSATAVGAREAGHKPSREYEHHFDWITDAVYSLDLEGAKKTAKEKEEERKREEEDKGQKGKRRRWRERKRARERGDEAVAEGNVERRGRERLIVTSGDGTMSTIDPRMGKKGVEVSEDQEDELLSVCALKHGRKLVVGTQLGMLSLWSPSRGLLDHVDRIPGHPSSVDSLCKLDEDTVLTGSSDGLIRVVQVLPHRLLGVVGDHEGMPVERIRRKEGVVASVGHGLCVRLTDVSELLEEGSDEEESDGEDDDGAGKVRLPLGLKTGGEASSDEEEGEDDDDEAAEEGLVDVGSESDEEHDEADSKAPSRKKARTAASEEDAEDDDDDSDDDSDGESQAKGVTLNKAMARRARKEGGAATLAPTSLLGGVKKGKDGAAGFWDGL